MKSKQTSRKKTTPPQDTHGALRQHLAKLLDWQDAHLDFDAVLGDWPVALRGVRPPGAPHTPWQLLEHIRICQWDILDFSRNPAYQELKFADYWPPAPAPPSDADWEKSPRAFRRD